MVSFSQKSSFLYFLLLHLDDFEVFSLLKIPKFWFQTQILFLAVTTIWQNVSQNYIKITKKEMLTQRNDDLFITTVIAIAKINWFSNLHLGHI